MEWSAGLAVPVELSCLAIFKMENRFTQELASRTHCWMTVRTVNTLLNCCAYCMLGYVTVVLAKLSEI